MTDPAAEPAFHTSRPKRRTLGAQLSRPARRFIATEAGSAGVLAFATLLALTWANSPWSGAYEELWHTRLSLQLGGSELALDLRHWVDEGLMALFFFVVGLEVRREWSMGELTNRRRAVVPLVGAIGGMLIPALIFLAWNPGSPEAGGWGIVIATDTAFLLGALALVGPTAGTQLRVFLLTAAIIDDIVAISVIGIFYSGELDAAWLLAAGAGLVAFALLARLRIGHGAIYLLLGVATWLATLHAGLHPTIAGMATGLLVAAYTPTRREVETAAGLTRAFRQSPIPSVARRAKLGVERSISPNERLLGLLHPWTSYLVVPLFAFAYAGIDLRGGVLADSLASPLTWGIATALVAGKLLGIGGSAIIAARAGLGELPAGVSERQIAGGAALSGIGFTVSLLIASLAFEEGTLRDQATIGVLLAVVLSVLVGGIIFRIAAVLHGETTASLPMLLAEPVDPARDHIRGPADAPLTLVEYADFECPFCSRSTGVVAELRERLGDELRYVFRHLPLEDVHPRAEFAAEFSEAVAANGEAQFWQLHDLLFADQDDLDPDELYAYAGRLGIDVDELNAALDSGRPQQRVREDVRSAEASGARGTPTFFVNGRRVVGAYDATTLERLLRGLV